MCEGGADGTIEVIYPFFPILDWILMQRTKKRRVRVGEMLCNTGTGGRSWGRHRRGGREGPFMAALATTTDLSGRPAHQPREKRNVAPRPKCPTRADKHGAGARCAWGGKRGNVSQQCTSANHTA